MIFGGFCESLQGASGYWGFWEWGPGFLMVSSSYVAGHTSPSWLGG
jgi:hypothetical protein